MAPEDAEVALEDVGRVHLLARLDRARVGGDEQQQAALEGIAVQARGEQGEHHRREQEPHARRDHGRDKGWQRDTEPWNWSRQPIREGGDNGNADERGDDALGG